MLIQARIAKLQEKLAAANMPWICNVTEVTFELITIYKNKQGNVLFPGENF